LDLKVEFELFSLYDFKLQDADAAFMVGAFPRKEGMERKDLLSKNIDIFKVSKVSPSNLVFNVETLLMI
jgi:malate/lactate dehydrogenase